MGLEHAFDQQPLLSISCASLLQVRRTLRTRHPQQRIDNRLCLIIGLAHAQSKSVVYPEKSSVIKYANQIEALFGLGCSPVVSQAKKPRKELENPLVTRAASRK